MDIKNIISYVKDKWDGLNRTSKVLLCVAVGFMFAWLVAT